MPTVRITHFEYRNVRSVEGPYRTTERQGTVRWNIPLDDTEIIVACNACQASLHICQLDDATVAALRKQQQKTGKLLLLTGLALLPLGVTLCILAVVWGSVFAAFPFVAGGLIVLSMGICTISGIFTFFKKPPRYKLLSAGEPLRQSAGWKTMHIVTASKKSPTAS